MSESDEVRPTPDCGASWTWAKWRDSKPVFSRHRLARLWRRTVEAILLLSMIAVCLYPAGTILDGHPATLPAAILFAAIFASLGALAHEIGHAVAAWAVGWRVHLIVVGSRAFAPQSKRFHRVAVAHHRREIYGWVLATPPPDTDWNDGEIPFVLGGPLANLLLGAGLILAASTIVGAETYLSALLIGLGGVSLALGIANLIPFSEPGVCESDGAQLIGALRGEVPSVDDQKISRLCGMVYDDVPFEEWDISVLNTLADKHSDEQKNFHPILVSYAFAMGDLESAKILLERHLPDDTKEDSEGWCMYAFAVAMLDKDALHASEILEKIPRKLAKKSFSFWRARAVTTYLLGRHDEAHEAIRTARQGARRMGASPDEDDEAVFEAIALGRELPRLVPRQRLAVAGRARSEVDEQKATESPLD